MASRWSAAAPDQSAWPQLNSPTKSVAGWGELWVPAVPGQLNGDSSAIKVQPQQVGGKAQGPIRGSIGIR